LGMRLRMVSFVSFFSPSLWLLRVMLKTAINICFPCRLSLPIRARQDPMSLWVNQVSWIFELTTHASELSSLTSTWFSAFPVVIAMSTSGPTHLPPLSYHSCSRAVLISSIVLCHIPHIPQALHQCIYLFVRTTSSSSFIIIHSTVALSYI